MGRGWIALAVVAAGCAFEPDGARRVDPPPAYQTWWERTQACSARNGDFSRLEFFAVPGAEFTCPTGQCVGRWEPGHRIYIAEKFLASELVVRHEMLHELLGGGGHPNPPFGHGCPLTWDSWNGPAYRAAAPVVID